MNEREHDAQQPRRGTCRLGRRARFGIAGAGLVAAGALVGALATAAVTVSAHGGFRHHSAANVEEAREYAAFKVGRMLESVEATPEQSERVSAIVADLVETLHPLIRQHRQNRRALMQELARPEVDSAALETLRRAELELFETGSAELVSALSAAAEVLTPEQRQALIEHRRGRFRH